MMQYMETELVRAETEECIQNCEECHRVCTETLTYSLQMGGKYLEADHLRLLHDCIQICRTSADFMRRDSPFHGLTCGLCAIVCEHCMEHCAWTRTIHRCAPVPMCAAAAPSPATRWLPSRRGKSTCPCENTKDKINRQDAENAKSFLISLCELGVLAVYPL
jgi:hypothetical protein